VTRIRFGLVLAAVLALAVAGTATATSVITGKSVKDGTLTGKDVKNHSLTKKDFRGDLRGPRGFRGFTGAQGPIGQQGPPGPTVVGQITVVRSAQVPFGDNVVQSATAFCPGGQRVVSGGGASISDEQLAVTEPTDDRSGWFVIGVDLQADDPGSPSYVEATALCAPAGQATAASVSHTKARAQVAAARQKVAAQVKR
jgi:hypothetical protein